jgi:hypothetical protein
MEDISINMGDVFLGTYAQVLFDKDFRGKSIWKELPKGGQLISLKGGHRITAYGGHRLSFKGGHFIGLR